MESLRRFGVIGIVVKTVEKTTAPLEVQRILTEFAEIIVGRMGVPDKELGLSAISVIVKGTVEQLSALTGKIGKIKNVAVKSALVNIN